MKTAQEEIPEHVVKLQKERLNQDEFNFCKKLYDKIQSMPTLTAAHREKVLDYIKKQSSKKFELLIFKFENPPKELEIYKMFLNSKECFIVFNLLEKEPVNIIPSGVMVPQTN
jgi:hypothetical protein